MNAEHLQGQFCSPIITTGRTRLVLGRAGDRGPAPRIALASEEGVVKVVLTESAPDEMAFYEALETNEASVRLLGDSELKAIARELTDYLRNNLKTDWSVRESVRAAMRVRVKLILRRHKYPPDMEQRAVDLVLKQAEALSEAWVA